MTTGVNKIKVTVTQPALGLEFNMCGELSQEAMISFGRWYKGDKGDSWENDFDIASNKDIDTLFDY